MRCLGNLMIAQLENEIEEILSKFQNGGKVFHSRASKYQRIVELGRSYLLEALTSMGNRELEQRLIRSGISVDPHALKDAATDPDSVESLLSQISDREIKELSKLLADRVYLDVYNRQSEYLCSLFTGTDLSENEHLIISDRDDKSSMVVKKGEKLKLSHFNYVFNTNALEFEFKDNKLFTDCGVFNVQKELTIEEFSIKDIERLIHKYNDEAFEGKLVIDFPVKLSKRSNALGSVTIKGGKVTAFRINTAVKVTQGMLESTIIHELIHVYQAQCCDYSYIKKYEGFHGKTFIEKSKELVSKGFPDALSSVSTEITKKRKAYVIYSDSGSIALFSKEPNSYTKDRAKRFLGGSKIYAGQIESDKMNNMSLKRVDKDGDSKISKYFIKGTNFEEEIIPKLEML